MNLKQEEQTRREWKRWERADESCKAKMIDSPPMPNKPMSVISRDLTLWYIWNTRTGKRHITKLYISTAASLFDKYEEGFYYPPHLDLIKDYFTWQNKERGIIELTEEGYAYLLDLANRMYEEQPKELEIEQEVVLTTEPKKKVSVISKIKEVLRF